MCFFDALSWQFWRIWKGIDSFLCSRCHKVRSKAGRLSNQEPRLFWNLMNQKAKKMSTLADLGFDSQKLKVLHELIGKFENIKGSGPLAESTSNLSKGLKALKHLTNYNDNLIPVNIVDDDVTVDLNDKSTNACIDSIELHIKGGPLAESTRNILAQSESSGDNENIIPSSIPTQLPQTKKRFVPKRKRVVESASPVNANNNSLQISQSSESLLQPEKKVSRRQAKTVDTKKVETIELFESEPNDPPSSSRRSSRKMSNKGKGKFSSPLKSSEVQADTKKVEQVKSTQSKKQPKKTNNAKSSNASVPKNDSVAVAPTAGKGKITMQKNLNKRNAKGETPLHAACSKQDFKTVEKLLDQGAEPNTQDYNLWTPVHELASYPSSTPHLKLLLGRGANPNVPGGEDNQTPLHEASATGCIENSILLIQMGASKTARDAQGKTPLDVALNEETRKILEDTMCEITDTEELETTVLLNQSTIPDLLVLYAHSDLSPEQVKFMKDQCKSSLEFKVSSSLNEDVTHLVVQLDPEKKSCGSDPIYLQAILMGKWIVDFHWFQASLESKEFLPETDYVAKGSHDCRTNAPTKAKENFSSRRPRLFDGCHIYLKGLFSEPYPSKADLMSLLKSGGANILRREPDPESIPKAEQRIPYHVKKGSSLEKCSHYIIFQEGLKEPELKYNMNHCKSLPAVWLLECIKNFELIEPF